MKGGYDPHPSRARASPHRPGLTHRCNGGDRGAVGADRGAGRGKPCFASREGCPGGGDSYAVGTDRVLGSREPKLAGQACGAGGESRTTDQDPEELKRAAVAGGEAARRGRDETKAEAAGPPWGMSPPVRLSLIHISEPTRRTPI